MYETVIKFASTVCPLFNVQIQLYQLDILGVNFPPFPILLNSVFKFTGSQRKLKWVIHLCFTFKSLYMEYFNKIIHPVTGLKDVHTLKFITYKIILL